MAIDKAKAAAREKAWREANPEAVKAYNDAYREANRENIRAKHKAWRDRNREHVRSKNGEWAHNNRPKLAAKARAYYCANPDRAKAVGHRRRARMAMVENTLTAADVRELRLIQGGRCACCKTKGRLTLDHIIPIARGGGHTRRNAQLLCRSCNASKNASDPIDFMQRRGFLL